MELDLLWLILAIAAGSYIIVYAFVRRVNEWYHVSKLGEKRHFLPPGDMGWPFLGNMPSFLRAYRSNNPETFIDSIVERYGRTGVYKTHLFGNPSIIVSSPQTCRRVLMDDEKFGLGYGKSMTRLAGKNTFVNIAKSEHRRLRKMMTSLMISHEALVMYIGNIEDVAIASLEEWAAASKDEPIEFFCETSKLSLKFIMRILFGSTSDSIFSSVEKHYIDVHDGVHSTAINLPGFAFHKALKARKMLVKILQKVVDERKAMKKNGEQTAKRGMIDLMMEIEDESGKKLQDEDIVDLLIVLLLGAHDGPTHTIIWATIYLYGHPQILQKAKVIDETLRLMNLPFLDFREAKTDANIKGYTIPKGWKVLIWNRAVHMDPENFSAPKEFDPSRWDNNAAEPGSFIPFGGGSRRCLGIDVAKIEVSIFLHYFLLNYKLEQLNPESPIVYLPTTRPSDNCPARVIKLK
ncbi:Ent-kaurenoic acid oxidase 2 [Citrus sinensis]|uniref:Ent-kaurenoic acid oxidase 2 n=2 Tax=Citrus sinensis TaxID=2711 RepID=A0ACB8L8R5_CITSI|nr:Ent-kaurenoic acid oxidase 2 [Citrus sinensis]